MIKIIKSEIVSHDCWGRVESEERYIAMKNDKKIATFSYKPAEFLKELGVKFKEK